MTRDFNTIMIVILIVLCFILLIMNNKKQENIESFYVNGSSTDETGVTGSSTDETGVTGSSTDETGVTVSSTDETGSGGGSGGAISNTDENKDSITNPSEKGGLEPIMDNINLNVEVVTIAKDYNGIQVSFKKKKLSDVKYYLHVYRLDKDGKELSGQGSYLLVGLDPKEDKEVNGRLISNPIPIKHDKAEKYMVALQYSYSDEKGITNESGYEFPNNLVSQNKIFTLNKPIKDQVAEYKNFEKYVEQKQQIEIAKLQEEEEEKSRMISNADGTFNVENLQKSLGGFPDTLFLDQSAISSLDELINRNLKLGILNVNAHIAENEYKLPVS